MIDQEVKNYIKKSVLCWLATCNDQHEPNVSPKEIFTWQDDTTLLIANIASRNSVKNIEANPNVCVSFVDIFVQKGYKLKGKARIITKNDPFFLAAVNCLKKNFTGNFPIESVISIAVFSAEKIIAPSYFLFPETTEESQIQNALSTYQVQFSPLTTNNL